MRAGRRLECHVVHKAEPPVLSRLEAPHDRVVRRVKVLRRVGARRTVAASHVPALEAEAQVHPPATRLEAFLAALGSAWLDILDVIKVGALGGQAEPPCVCIEAYRVHGDGKAWVPSRPGT
jgi:hypothetical protein